MKICTKCFIKQSFNNFYSKKEHKDGLSSQCKTCFKMYYKNNKVLIAEKDKIYYTEHKIERAHYHKAWRTVNAKYIAKYKKDWKKVNIALVKLGNLRHRTNRNLRIPQFGQDEIAEFYQNCPDGMVVDHVIPLIGKQVSGLHVKWNLQYLTPHENDVKLNTFDGTLENNSWRSLLN
jgi:hypothetical protein